MAERSGWIPQDRSFSSTPLSRSFLDESASQSFNQTFDMFSPTALTTPRSIDFGRRQQPSFGSPSPIPPEHPEGIILPAALPGGGAWGWQTREKWDTRSTVTDNTAANPQCFVGVVFQGGTILGLTLKRGG